MRIVLTPLAKSVLILSAIDAAIQKKNKNKIGSGMTALIVLNEEMENIMKIMKSLEK